MGMRTIAALRDILLTARRKTPGRAGEHRVRFWRLRPSYIYRTREHLVKVCGLKLENFWTPFRTAGAP